MKTITIFLLFAACHSCFAGGDTNNAAVDPWAVSKVFDIRPTGANIIAESDWSEPVVSCDQALRARMLLSHEYINSWSETEFYVELHNVTSAAEVPMQIYFDPWNSLQCHLLDANGKAPRLSIPWLISAHMQRDGFWITLPHDSTIRLRVDVPGQTRLTKGDLGDFLVVDLPRTPPATYSEFGINPGDTNVYYLSGTFTVASPTNHVAKNVESAHAEWTGTLELPKTKIALSKP